MASRQGHTPETPLQLKSILCGKTHLQQRAYHHSNFESVLKLLFTPMEKYVSTEVHFIPLSRQHKFLHFMTTIFFEQSHLVQH
jgi:hypothetical protein